MYNTRRLFIHKNITIPSYTDDWIIKPKNSKLYSTTIVLLVGLGICTYKPLIFSVENLQINSLETANTVSNEK